MIILNRAIFRKNLEEVTMSLVIGEMDAYTIVGGKPLRGVVGTRK